MNVRKLSIVLLTLVLSLALFATGCAQPTATATPAATPTAAAAQTVLRFNLGSEPPALNSTIATDTVSFNILRHIEEGLTRLDANQDPVPGIATSWDKSTDGLVWTFHLRDAKWSDGSDVTADDFVFSWTRLLDPATASEYAYFGYIFKGGLEFNSVDPADTAKYDAAKAGLGFKAIDAKTLEVTLAAPITYLLGTLAFPVLLPIKQSFYESVGATDFGADPDKLLYNGPFVLDTWNHEQNIVLKKNDGYYDAASIKLTEVDMDMLTDAQAAFTKFLNGDYDLIGLANSDFVKQATDAGYTPKDFSDGATFYLEFNTLDKFLKNAKVRTAISYAMDRQSYIDKIMKDKSQPALAFVNPEIQGPEGGAGPSYREWVGNLIQDNQTDAAKAILKEGLGELGLPNTDDDLYKVEINIICDIGDVAVARASALAQSITKNLGISCGITAMPFKSRLARMKAKDFQCVYAGWGPDYNDPMTFLDMFETGNGNNHTSYSSAAYDALLATARSQMADTAARYATYKQMETLLMTDLPIAPIYYRIRTWTSVADLQGIARGAFEDLNFRDAYFGAAS